MQILQRFAGQRLLQLLMVTTVLFFASCGGAKHAQHVETPSHFGPEIQGVASWYGRPFHGRRMANGQRFDMNQPTAAHRTLPFGTQVEVTNLNNEKKAIVTITDRGPFIKGRILDVSRKVAQDLSFIASGTAPIAIRVIQ